MKTEKQIFWTLFYTFAGGFVLALFAIAYRVVEIELQEDIGSRVSPLRDNETKVEDI